MFGLSGKTWRQVALATVGGLIILVGISVCFAATGGTTDPVERMEARGTARAAPTATPEIVCPTPEEAAYFDKVEKTAGLIAEASLEHAELLGMVADNPAVANDVGWEQDVVATLSKMRPAIEDFRSVTAPESVQEIHDEFTLALDILDEGIVLITDGFKWISPYKVESGYRMIRDSQPVLKAAGGKKLAFCMAKIGG